MTKTLTISLHCPSRNLTIPTFVISPFQNLDQVLQGIRLAFDIPFAALYTVSAKHIADPQNLDDGQRVLVKASKDEEMLPDAPMGWVVYLGGGAEGEWDDLNDAEKTAHVTRLVQDNPTTRNILRITRSYHDVEDDLAAFSCHSTAKNNGRSSSEPEESNDAESQDTSRKAQGQGGLEAEDETEDAESLIQTCWLISLDSFLHPLTSLLKTPSKSKAPATNPSSRPLISALALLSSLTHGQPRLARNVLEEAIHMRLDAPAGSSEEEEKDSAVRTEDVKMAVEIMYERAGAIPAKWTKEKKSSGKAKGSGRERRKAAKQMKLPMKGSKRADEFRHYY